MTVRASSRRGEPGATRSSRLTAAVALLALLVVGVELALFLRTVRRSPADPPRAAEVVAPQPVATEPRGPAPQLPGRSLHPVSAAVPAAPPPSDESIPTTAPASASRVGAALRRRDLLLAAHNQQAIQEADERVFAQLNLPEQQRVAIRLVNERQARRRQELVAAEPDQLTPEEQAGASIEIGDRVARERQASLRESLGSEAYQSFQLAETAEIRRLQRRYRVQWAQELDEQAPLPPGLPPRAH
jgi:hypothetical protein